MAPRMYSFGCCWKERRGQERCGSGDTLVLTRSLRMALLRSVGTISSRSPAVLRATSCTYQTKIISCFSFPFSSSLGQISQ